jgi:Tfp pilus assembly protein PilW
MNMIFSQSDDPARNARTTAGHTLIEMMFAATILVVLVLALLSAQWVGMQQEQLVSSKAGASDSSRRALNQLPVDIRSSKMWFIGSLSGSTFTPLANGSAQQGAALQLCQTTNGSQYILYYFDTTDMANSNGKLMRNASNTNWSPVCLASNLINTLYFRAENYNEVVQTNTGSSKSYKNVIHTTLQFKQFQYPLTQVGSNCLYDFYQLDFMATPHLPE